MDLKRLTLKSILIIFNSLNITTGILSIIIAFFTDSTANIMIGNYIMMIISAICCAAAVMESYCILLITANLFLSKIIVTISLLVYKVTTPVPYAYFAMLLYGVIACLAYYMSQKIQLEKLNNLIATYTGIAAIPLSPPAHVRSDVI